MSQVLIIPREANPARAASADRHDPSKPVPNPLPKLLTGEDLPSEDAEHLFERLVLGKLEPAEIAGMLIALRMKGETAEEMIGAARALADYEQDPEVLARRAMQIASEVCVFTNDRLTIETVE